MKILYEKKVELRGGKLIKDLAIGSVFGGKIGNIEGVFLKTFSNVVNLENPRETWCLPVDELYGQSACGAEYVNEYKELNAEVTIL